MKKLLIFASSGCLPVWLAAVQVTTKLTIVMLK